ncbi:unnamed protein product, partial [Sphacelaria rigidula]
GHTSSAVNDKPHLATAKSVEPEPEPAANPTLATIGNSTKTSSGFTTSSGRSTRGDSSTFGGCGAPVGAATSSNGSGGIAVPSGALWARRSPRPRKRAGGGTSVGSESPSDDDDDGDDDDDDDGGGHNRAWSMDDDISDENDGSDSGSWGSGGGDYQPAGNGKLVSDAEFFQYCGSPERARQASEAGAGNPPMPASWSSEDALMQHYEGKNPAAPRFTSPNLKPSTTSSTNRGSGSPPRLPAGALGGPRGAG